MSELTTAQQDLQTLEQAGGKTLTARIADRFGVAPDRLLATLRDTCFKVDGTPVTNAQMLQLMVVIEAHQLNPFTKEIYAFKDKWGKVVPVVSIDGWARIINENPAMDGLEFEYADEMAAMPGAKSCPAWCEAIIYRKDRSRPTRVREYLDEVYQQSSKPGPWQSHTKRFLRHKALIQAARVAFGFAGIFDHDEAERILQGTGATGGTQSGGTTDDKRDLAEQLRAGRKPAEEEDITDAEFEPKREDEAGEPDDIPPPDCDPDTGEMLPPELQSHPNYQSKE